MSTCCNIHNLNVNVVIVKKMIKSLKLFLNNIKVKLINAYHIIKKQKNIKNIKNNSTMNYNKD